MNRKQICMSYPSCLRKAPSLSRELVMRCVTPQAKKGHRYDGVTEIEDIFNHATSWHSRLHNDIQRPCFTVQEMFILESFGAKPWSFWEISSIFHNMATCCKYWRICKKFGMKPIILIFRDVLTLAPYKTVQMFLFLNVKYKNRSLQNVLGDRPLNSANPSTKNSCRYFAGGKSTLFKS